MLRSWTSIRSSVRWMSTQQEMKNEQVIETVKKAFQKELIVIDALATTKKGNYRTG